MEESYPNEYKNCGKRRNCSLRAIFPFPTVFSKGLFPRGVKRCHCVGMGKVLSTLLTLYPIDTRFEVSTTNSFLKHCGEKEKLLVTSSLSFSHNVSYSIGCLNPYLSIFFTSYLYLLLNWKTPKLAYQVKG